MDVSTRPSLKTEKSCPGGDISGDYFYEPKPLVKFFKCKRAVCLLHDINKSSAYGEVAPMNHQVTTAIKP